MATAEDLGTQGEPPSHPELLDWLAVELMDHDWSLKHIHRLIVTSATYQQSSAVTPELLAARSGQSAARPRAAVPRRRRSRSATSRWRPAACLHRQSRRPERLSAGAGVPVPAAGQLRPEDLDRTTPGPTRYRRGALHVPLPLGAVSRCCRTSTPRPASSPASAASRSNTPLQALTTLNEPLFLECARALAAEDRSPTAATSDAERLTLRRPALPVARAADRRNSKCLQEFLDRADSSDSAATAPTPGRCSPTTTRSKDELDAKLPDGATPADLAAWTAVARVVLNLDETITKE